MRRQYILFMLFAFLKQIIKIFTGIDLYVYLPINPGFCGVMSRVEIFMHILRSCRWEKHLLWTEGWRCGGEGLRHDLTSFKKVQGETRALFQSSDLPLHAHAHACNARHCPHKNPALTFRIPQCAEVFVLDTAGAGFWLY